jgi:hypothetical protein
MIRFSEGRGPAAGAGSAFPFIGFSLGGTVPSGTSVRRLAMAWSCSYLLELGLYPNSLLAVRLESPTHHRVANPTTRENTISVSIKSAA